MKRLLHRLSVEMLIVLFFIGTLLAFYLWIQNDPNERSKYAHGCYDPRMGAQECYEKYYDSLARTKGVDVALQTLSEHRSTDGALARSCHNTMHVIGRVAFYEYGSLARAYEHVDYSCWSGYSHGVVEGALRGTKIEDVTQEKLRALCAEVGTSTAHTYLRFNCVHGLGHALMYIATNDIPRALSKCEILEDAWARDQCTTGVFMENTLADKDHFSRFIPTDDLNFPCSIVDAKHQQSCYLVQGKFILDAYKNDFQNAFAFCGTISAHSLRVQCARGLGKLASEHANYDPIRANAYCELADTPLTSACLFGVLQDLAGATGSTGQGMKLCDSKFGAQRELCVSILRETEFGPSST